MLVHCLYQAQQERLDIMRSAPEAGAEDIRAFRSQSRDWLAQPRRFWASSDVMRFFGLDIGLSGSEQGCTGAYLRALVAEGGRDGGSATGQYGSGRHGRPKKLQPKHAGRRGERLPPGKKECKGWILKSR